MNSNDHSNTPLASAAQALLDLLESYESDLEGGDGDFLLRARQFFGVKENIIPFPGSRLPAFSEIQTGQQEMFRQAADSGEQLIPVYRIGDSFFYSEEPEEILWIGTARWGASAQAEDGVLSTIALGDELKVNSSDKLLLFHRREDAYLLQRMANQSPDPLIGGERVAKTSAPLPGAVLSPTIGEEGLLAPCLFVQASSDQ